MGEDDRVSLEQKVRNTIINEQMEYKDLKKDESQGTPECIVCFESFLRESDVM